MFSFEVVKVYDMTGDDDVYLVLHLRHPKGAEDKIRQMVKKASLANPE